MKENTFNRIGHLFRQKINKIEQSHKSINEMSKDAYLETLAPLDRKHVENFIAWVERYSSRLNPENIIAVHAVGSSVRSADKRYAPVNDIDLRILNSRPALSQERRVLIKSLENFVERRLNVEKVNFEKRDHTETTRWVKGFSIDPKTGVGRTEVMPYLDWYNKDTSYIAKFSDGGKPLHISVSGLNNFDLKKYLAVEIKGNGYFSSLYNSEKDN